MTTNDYPAIKQYWFGKAYRDMWDAIKDSHGRNIDSAKEYWGKIKPPDEVIDWIPALFFGSAAVMVVVFGTIVWAILVPLHVLFVAVIAAVIMVCFGVINALEWAYLKIKGWSTICRHCGGKISLPEYQCPRCHEWHNRLRPSSYGILRHQCRCGEKLPCSFLTRPKPRHDLDARCPRAHCHGPMNAAVETQSSSTVIPIIGPPSSGKTGFIIAAMEVLLGKIAPCHGFTGQFTDRDSEQLFADEKHFIQTTGSTRKTADSRLPAFNAFFKSNGDGKVRHQVFLFDAAGEIYLSTDKLHGHDQFRHASGAILILDPFSLRGVRNRYGETLRKLGLDKSIAQGEAVDVVDHLLNSMQRHFDLKPEQLIEFPCAVVVTKTDLCGLAKRLELKRFSAGVSLKEKRQQESDHIRSQLEAWGGSAFVHQLESRTAITMYFRAAPIRVRQSAKGIDAELVCLGVEEPISWLLERARDPLVRT